MSFTRLAQGHGEMQHINELDEDTVYGTGSASISNTKAKTGTYSFAYSNATRPRGKVFSTTQIRANVFVNHNGVSAGSSGRIALIYHTKGTYDILVGWDDSDQTLRLYVNGTLRASINVGTAGFSTTNTWYSVGLTCKADASTGFVSVYLNGTQILTWTGNTGTTLTGCYFGGRTHSTSCTTWNGTVYFDDFYVDSASSEADAPPTSYRFLWSLVGSAGTSAGWTAAGTTPNYACVDETGAPNDDTDYVSAASSGLIDYYNTANVTVPTGYAVSAVIPYVWTKKTDAGTDSKIKVGVRLSGSNSTNTAQSLATAYGPIAERQTAKPGSGSWTETDVNNAELMIESAGTF